MTDYRRKVFATKPGGAIMEWHHPRSVLIFDILLICVISVLFCVACSNTLDMPSSPAQTQTAHKPQHTPQEIAALKSRRDDLKAQWCWLVTAIGVTEEKHRRQERLGLSTWENLSEEPISVKLESLRKVESELREVEAELKEN